MNFTFLASSVPIVKRYSIGPDKSLVKHPYPFVYEVSSYEVECPTLAVLQSYMLDHARLGHCLLKGTLTRPLVNESRAGTTDRNEPTSWVCLDLDGVTKFATPHQFMTAIGADQVDYITQWSSGMGIDAHEGLRCHIFMLLSKPAHPQLLKQWLMHLNLNITDLREQMQLTKTGNSLRWPLDITTCQNDKLIYVSPPKLDKNIKDPFPKNDRIYFTKGHTRSFTLPTPIPSKDALAELADKRINELRVAANLPKRRKTRSKFSGQIEYMPNPDSATVTEIKVERGFVYLNLNGGDSWGYYHPEDNATFIFNFKGEPTYRTEDLLPEYWASIQQQAQSYQPNSQGMVYLAFRDFKSATYYNGTFNAETNTLNIAVAKSETQLRHFMQQRGQIMGQFVPDWDIVWEPNNPLIVDAPNQRLNIFKSSALMSAPPQSKKVTKVPPTIKRILQHVVNNSQDTYTQLINWIACIVQFRTMTGTAWVLHGTEGCLAGDTILEFRRGRRNGGRPLTIADAYAKWTGTYKLGMGRGKTWTPELTTFTKSVRDRQTVGFHEVLRIVESGVKQLYTLRTTAGRTIRVTEDHPFMRANGSFTPLNKLNPGDELVVEGEHNAHVATPRGRKQRSTTHSVPHHPHAWKHTIAGKNYKRMHTARLVVEAHTNFLHLHDYIQILRTDPLVASTLTYLSPDVVVHHLDEDPSNDDISNLALVSKDNHDKHHAKEVGLGTINTKLEYVESIAPSTTEMTYDVMMKAPYHNYIANGFAVHNTGKGVLYHHILSPLLGHDNVVAKKMRELESEFTGYLENKLFVFIDEVETGKRFYEANIDATLRNLIVEPMISIRKMYQMAYMAPNHSNMMFASNKPEPVNIPPSDRRFNVGYYQPESLAFEDADIQTIQDELPDFYSFLYHYSADRGQARKPIKNEAKAQLASVGRSSIDTIADAILQGDLTFFWDHLPASKSSQLDGFNSFKLMNYRTLVIDLVTKNETKLTRDDLYTLFEWCVGGMPSSPNKFTSLLKHHRIHLTQIWKNSRNVRGIETKWNIDPTWHNAALREIKDKVV